ncbi:hypothetical protein KP509_01G052400 [Ceratopteris richardii]|nr:hypothetical protein KP509_01G052400 [Ceratopteris richardii]
MLQYNLVSVTLFSASLVFGITLYFITRPFPVYMVDFACYRAPKEDMCSNANFMRCSVAMGVFNEKSLEFQRKICERSGLGEETYLPPAVISDPPNPCMAEARREAERVMFGAIDELFEKTGLKPKDVGILIVNCSLFVPTPSLPAIIVNHYNMRGNIKSFNLGGMGCSAGVISIDLARHLLQVHKNTTALVVSMENITLNWYWGNDRSKLLSNCIFRMGGAAILLSNSRSMKVRSKYELVHSVRTHKGADDKAYSCVFQEEDCETNVGVSLSKDLMSIAGNALKANITTLGPLVLPLSEQILFFASVLVRKLGAAKVKPYIPNFKLAFEHFCIHAGGRAVLDEIQNNLKLADWHMEPSRMTLFRFGNTSSSSLWYELAYTEAKGRVNRGDRIWQIAFGSGFKCNSAVWRSLGSVSAKEPSNVWSSFIDSFPVKVPTFRSLS